MKNLILAIGLLLLATNIFAQSDKYVSAMEANLAKGTYQAEPKDLINVANAFERIASAEPEQWLPSYYASLMHMYVAQKSLQNQETDQLEAAVEKAWENIEKAEAISGENSEVLALKAYVYFGYIWKNPMVNGALYSGKAYKLLDQAMVLDPSNPRPYYLKGQNTFFTPAMWGGGVDAAKPLLLKAQEKFKTFEKENSLSPVWGEGGNNFMLSKVGVEVAEEKSMDEEMEQKGEVKEANGGEKQ